MWRILVALAVAFSAGCSVSGKVQLHPGHESRYLGAVGAEVEFSHEF